MTVFGRLYHLGMQPSQLVRPTQPCIPLGSLNGVRALIGWGIYKGGNVVSAGWQVTLCDPIRHVSSRSGAVLVAYKLLYASLPFTLYPRTMIPIMLHVCYTISTFQYECTSSVLIPNRGHPQKTSTRRGEKVMSTWVRGI